MLSDLAIKELASLGLKAGNAEVQAIEGLQGVAFVGGKPVSLEEFEPTPRRKTADVQIIKPSDFCQYVNRHKEARTELFASLKGLSVTAVIDSNGGGQEGPGWKSHKAKLALTPYRDFVTWQESNGKEFGQIEFGHFLERLSHTVVEPDAAKMVGLVQKLSYTRAVKCDRPKYDDVTGSFIVSYSDELDQKGEMKLPSQIFLCAAPFVGAPPSDFVAKLRMRPIDGGVKIFYDIQNLDLFLEEQFEAVLKTVEDATGIRPLLGP